MTPIWQSLIFIFAPFLAPVAAAQPFPEFASRAAALEDADAGNRLGGVVYFGSNGLATDGSLLVKRLADGNPDRARAGRRRAI